MSTDFEIEIVNDDTGYTPVDNQLPEPIEGQQPGGDKGGDDAATTRKKRKQAARERIDELTRKFRDAERERDTLNQQLEDERRKQGEFVSNVRTQQEQSARIVFNTLSNNKKLLERNLQLARNAGDTKSEMEILDQLDSARSQMQQVKQYYPTVDQGDTGAVQQPAATTAAPAQQPQATTTQQPQQAVVPEAAKSWIAANQVLKGRAELHPLINGLDMTLKAEGKDPTKPEFYAELNRRLKKVVPEDIGNQLKDGPDDDVDLSFLDDDDDDSGDEGAAAVTAQAPAQPAQQPRTTTTAPAQRSDVSGATPVGKKRVKLTREQVAMAHRMGLSPEQYAASLTKQVDTNGYVHV